MGQGQTAALEVKAGKYAAACWTPTPPVRNALKNELVLSAQGGVGAVMQYAARSLDNFRLILCFPNNFQQRFPKHISDNRQFFFFTASFRLLNAIFLFHGSSFGLTEDAWPLQTHTVQLGLRED